MLPGPSAAPSKPNSLDWAAVRAEFPTLERWTFLDVARKTPAPRCQERAMQAYLRDIYEEAGAQAWSVPQITETRAALARLLGAKPAEIAFTKNTTEGLTIAAHAFDLAAGDNIVLTDMEHVANVWVWKHWQAKGVEIRVARNRAGRLPVEAFEEVMDARTRLVSTAYVTYGNGYRIDLPALGRLCQNRGARLVVDGVQAAGILAAPLSALGADMVAIGGHKGLFGLTGSGIVWCREALLEELRAPFLKPPGAAAAPSAHVNSQFDYVRTAHRFEGGNPNFLGVRVLREGARFLESIGLAAIEARVRELTDAFLRRLAAAGLATTTPQEWERRAQIVSVPLTDAAGVMQRLRDKHRVVVNAKDGALRVSMSFFNNEADLDIAIRALKQETRGEAG